MPVFLVDYYRNGEGCTVIQQEPFRDIRRGGGRKSFAQEYRGPSEGLGGGRPRGVSKEQLRGTKNAMYTAYIPTKIYKFQGGIAQPRL